MSTCDVVVIGGGMVGLVLALLLAEHDFNVVVIEQQDPFTKTAIASRVSAVNAASLALLKKLALWPLAFPESESALQRLVVWDGLGSGRLEFSAADVGLLALGSIVPNEALIKSAWQKLMLHPNVSLHVSEPTQLTVNTENVRLVLSEGTSFQAALCVGADGAHSFVREKMAVQLQTRSYQQEALIAVVETELSHQQTAWQIFLPEGPLAFLPLSNQHHSAIVWSASPAATQARLALPDASFALELNRAFGLSLGEITNPKARHAFPLVMRHATHYVARGLALVGDAAHTLHPLAGQGVNLGFQDAMALVDALLFARQKNKNLGWLSVLRRYERARKGDNTKMMLMMRGLNDLFRAQTSWVIEMRGAGLNVVQRFSGLKKYFIEQATR